MRDLPGRGSAATQATAIASAEPARRSRRASRGPSATSDDRKTASSAITVSFVSRPMPATARAAGSRRGSGRPRIRSATYENATQTGTSSIVGWKSTPSPSPYGVSANASEASSWLRKPPPSSRAHSATSTIESMPGEHAGQPQRDQRRARDVDHDAADERRHRREVDVAERQVPARLQEVQLVAIPAVAAEERQARGASFSSAAIAAGEQRRAQGSDVRRRVGHDARRLGRRRSRVVECMAARLGRDRCLRRVRNPGDPRRAPDRPSGRSRVILEDDDFQRFAGVG